jgi:phosphatidylserine synthase
MLPYVVSAAAPSGPLRQLFVIFLYFNCLSSGWWSIFAVVIEFHLVVLPVLMLANWKKYKFFMLKKQTRFLFRVEKSIVSMKKNQSIVSMKKKPESTRPKS